MMNEPHEVLLKQSHGQDNVAGRYRWFFLTGILPGFKIEIGRLALSEAAVQLGKEAFGGDQVVTPRLLIRLDRLPYVLKISFVDIRRQGHHPEERRPLRWHEDGRQ